MHANSITHPREHESYLPFTAGVRTDGHADNHPPVDDRRRCLKTRSTTARHQRMYQTSTSWTVNHSDRRSAQLCGKEKKKWNQDLPNVPRGHFTIKLHLASLFSKPLACCGYAPRPRPLLEVEKHKRSQGSLWPHQQMLLELCI